MRSIRHAVVASSTGRWVHRALAAAALVLLGSCGGGGGEQPPPEAFEVVPGFRPAGDVQAALNWELGAGGGDGSVGAGADGSGGVGVGGDFGQFRNTLVVVRKPDGTELGRAVTDDTFGMITIRPRSYQGPLLLEMIGGNGATYYEEGKGTYVPFPAGEVIRAWVPRIDKNIGITPFTETATRLLTEGSTPERVSGTPSADQIRAANDAVRRQLNDQFPKALEVSDITRLPFIKSPLVGTGSISTDPRGVYGLVNGAFSKQAAMFNPAEANPTLAALRQLGADLLDGRLDGTNAGTPAVPAGNRTYDPNTLTGELTSALAEQSFRFGTDSARGLLPPVLNFGNSRYEGYFFDASLKPGGQAVTTVAGWAVSDNLGRPIGTESPPKASASNRMFGVFGNMGHGGVLIKSDAPDSQSIVYGFGDNVYGEVGQRPANTPAGAALPIALPGILTHAAGGFGHTVVRLADGSVWTWGDNSFGQLGQGLDGNALPRTASPLRVNLPAGALAVAANNAASYALLVDGRVFSWGSNWGFGLLGDGNRDGSRTTPGAVQFGTAELGNVVQINARDTDVIVAQRDGTIITWGSHPSDPAGGFVPGDLGLAYQGGTLLPTAVTGLPTAEHRAAGVQVRKILTEQGLFVVLMSDGSVWSWGVHFDITAQQILRDLEPRRVLSVPRLRDLMPGGYIGYGTRPFDRLTAMGIDFQSNLWKIRGRVAEQYNPANPTQQRRPQGLSARPDCESCHIVINDWPLVNPVQDRNVACVPPSGIHGAGTTALIREDTTCEKCHNPGRVKNPPLQFAPNGWLICAKPSDLLPRPAPQSPVPLSGTCTLPAGHRFTPPGTTCSSCHNDIIAQALACGQPDARTLPSLLATASVTGLFNANNQPYARGAVTGDAQIRVAGTVATALRAGQLVRVLRNGTAVGVGTPSGTDWSFTERAPDGALNYSARVEDGTGFGATGAPFPITVDTAAPAATVTSIEIFDDVGNAVIADGGFTTDTTPVVRGTLSGPLASGETLRIVRDGVVLTATAAVNGTSWSFSETSARPLNARATYAVRPADAAGNLGTQSETRSIQVIAPLPTASITSVNDNFTGQFSVVVPAGGITRDATPLLIGTTTTGPVQIGQTVRVFRNGSSIGTASVDPPNWFFTDPAAVQGPNSYTARIELGGVNGPLSAPYSVVVDNGAPAVVASVTEIFDSFAGAAVANGGTTNDSTPTVSGTLSAALGTLPTPESLVVERSTASVGPWSAVTGSPVVSGTTWTFTEPGALGDATYFYRARVVDGAGNAGAATGLVRNVVVNTAIRTATPTSASAAGVGIANGGATNQTSLTLGGVVNTALALNQTVRVLRNGTLLAGTATVSGTSWSFSDAGLGNTRHTYTARVDTAGAAGTASASSFAVVVDTVAPTQTVSVAAGSDVYPYNNFPGSVANSRLEFVLSGSPSLPTAITNDTTPLFAFTPSAALAATGGTVAGESLEVTRGSVVVSLSAETCPTAIGPSGNTQCRRESASGVGAFTAPSVQPSSGGTVEYTVRVRDAAGNVGPATAVRVAYGYPQCNLARGVARNATVHSGAVVGQTNCQGCHQAPPSGSTAFMSAPPTSYPGITITGPLYWCTLPAKNVSTAVAN